MNEQLPPDPLPNPFSEIRVLSLHSLRGISYWSRRPVTRMDLNIGAYENISSAHVPWCTDQLVAALPGLVQHHCSVGRRGGFIERLRRGTYAAHITEHVALELQTEIGQDTGFGRTRGNGEFAEYTVVFEHQHQLVGLRAAALALDIVHRAFAGTLYSANSALPELRALATTPDTHPLANHVLCGITGSTGRADTRSALQSLLEIGMPRGEGEQSELVLDLSPGYLLHAGVPYATSDVAIVLDASPTDVSERYRDPERAARLVSMVADAVPPGGVVVCAADIPLVHEIVRDAGRLVRSFDPVGSDAIRAERAARCAADVIVPTVDATR